MEQKKISFSFNKLAKKQLITKQPLQEKKVELIDCVEGQSIKLKDAIVEELKGPLIIPLTESSNKIIDRIKESRLTKIQPKEEVDERPDSELTLDELAARELLREAKNSGISETASKLVSLPAVKDELILEGKEESTLEDYESVPISDYGFAMLRGMGWKDGMVIGKNQNATLQTKEPSLRPKGMGLGANKMASVEQKPPTNKDGEELQLIKGAFAKITAGHHKGSYCQVVGFDDEAGRVIVKTALKDLTLSLNEFLLVPVTKDDYNKSSKVINNTKFEEYKQKSDPDRSADDRRRSKDSLDDDRSVNKPGIDVDRKRERSVSPKEVVHKIDRRSRSRSPEKSNRKHKKKSKKHKRRNRSSSSDCSPNDRKEKRKRSRSRDKNNDRRHKKKSSNRR